MKKVILFLFVSLLVACGKDKFETKPRIEIESYKNSVLPPGENLVINLKFYDEEGDIGTGKFTYIPERLNRRPLPAGQEYVPVDLVIPEFSDHNKGEFELRLQWVDLHKSDLENDTIQLRMAATDREGHTSDTITSDRLVILRQ